VPTIPDHTLVSVMILVLPIVGAKLGLERIRRRIRAGKPDPRVRAYFFSMLQQWALAGACLWIWIENGRPWKAIGLSAPGGTGFWIALAVASGLAVFLLRQGRAVARDPELQAQVRRKLGRTEALIPRSSREAAAFDALSLTAGVCEELLYRGFLTWYLACYVSLDAAYVVAPCAFGLAHAYQGLRGILLTAAIGIVLSTLYLAGGTLWVPMAFHAFFDMHSGRMGRNALAAA
jgi:membrane protease YdiL (CAAX protease family)